MHNPHDHYKAVAKAPARRHPVMPRLTPRYVDKTFYEPMPYVEIETDDPVEIIPGEVETEATDFPVGSTVELSCPLCQGPMTCILKVKDVRSIKPLDTNVTSTRHMHFYDVMSRSCDCPEIWLDYRNQPV